MKVFNFYRIGRIGQILRHTIQFFIDEKDEYNDIFFKLKQQGSGIFVSPFSEKVHTQKEKQIFDASEFLYKNTDYIPARDEYKLYSQNGTATLYKRYIDGWCKIKHLEYEKEYDVKNCDYKIYREFLAECKDLGLTIPKELVR